MAPCRPKGRNQYILNPRSERVKRQLRAKHRKGQRSIKADKRRWTENIADGTEEAAKSQHRSTHPDLGGISALVSQTYFGGKTSRNVAKCRLFSQAMSPPPPQHPAKIFLFLSQFTKIQVSFACDLIFRTMSKFFHTLKKQLRRMKLVNKVFVTQVLFF